MEDYSFGSQYMRDLDREIMDLIVHGEDPKDPSKFNYLALKEWTFQFHNNPILRKHSITKYGIKSPDEIHNYEDIPVLPSGAYKKWRIISFPEVLLTEERISPAEARAKQLATHFTSNGTSSKTDEQGRPLVVGNFYRDPDAMELFDATITQAAKEYLFTDGVKRKFLLLSPPPEMLPSMPMIYDQELMRQNFGTEDRIYLISKEGFDAKKFVEELKLAEKTGQPLMVGGASFAFVPFSDGCKQKNLSFNLPKGSISVDGGGYKGRSREVPKQEFIETISQVFGLPNGHVINLLGYSEHPSLIYDNVFKNAVSGVNSPRYKPNLPWHKTLVVDPEKYPKETVFLKKGEKGILRHFDLSDRGTVIAVQTDDEGELIEDGFEIWGRAKEAGARGCSLAVEEMMKTITW
jgi:hypothetical protein